MMRFLCWRAAAQTAHSSESRSAHVAFAPASKTYCHRRAQVWQWLLPHVGPWSGRQLPGFRVGKPCVKQYISQESFPKRSASRILLSHSSFVRCPLVRWNKCWMGWSTFQSMFAICCSSTVRPPWKGFAKIDFPFTGGSCHRSPAKMTFRPPKGLRSRP